MENPTFLKLMDELKVIKNNQKNQKPKLWLFLWMNLKER
jgi:hypothetical protein